MESIRTAYANFQHRFVNSLMPPHRLLHFDSDKYLADVAAQGRCAVIRASGTTTGATAALAIAGPGGTTEVELFRVRGKGAAAEALANRARLDALTSIVENDPANTSWYSLYVDDPRLRAEIISLQESFPTLQLSGTPHEGASNAAAQAVHRITQTRPATKQITNTRTFGGATHLVIATDASVYPGVPGAGIAYAASDGTTYQGWMAHTCDTTWAELNAIHAAVKASTAHRRVLILSDSQPAVAMATGRQTPTQVRLRRLAAEIAAERKGRDLNIQWVRGHRGHLLNETADALAKRARHQHMSTAAA